MIDMDRYVWHEGDVQIVCRATKSARTITISSGGKKRDDALNPIIAAVKRRLIELAAYHGNRKVATSGRPLSVADLSTDELVMLRAGLTKYSEDEPRDEHGQWTEGGEGSGAVTLRESRAVTDWVSSYDAMDQIRGNPDSEAARAFASACEKSPPVNQTIYRGVHMNGMTPEMGKAYWDDQIGRTIGLRAPSSTSPTLQVAAAYAEPVLFKITPQDGAARDITWKLRELGQPRFKEAILAPGRFRVESVSVEPVKDSFYNPRQTRDAVVVTLNDVTKQERGWTTLPPKTVKFASPSRHRLQGTMDDVEVDDVVKFNENHDERGRFAESDSGGGIRGREWSRAGKVSPEERADYAASMKEYKALGGRWANNPDEVNPKAGIRALQTITELHAVTPRVPAPTVDIGAAEMFRPGVVAETEGSPWTPGQSSIDLSPKWWSKDPETWSPPESKWLVDATPEGYITHEYGHCVQNLLDTTMPRAYADWTMSFETGGSASGYGARGGNKENFAEWFTAAMTPGEYHDDPRAQSMRDMLVKSGVLASYAAKRSTK